MSNICKLILLILLQHQLSSLTEYSSYVAFLSSASDLSLTMNFPLPQDIGSQRAADFIPSGTVDCRNITG